MPTIPSYRVALLMTLLLATATQGATSPPWKLVSDRNDIRVYVRDSVDTPLKTFRGVTRFALADEYAMVALLNDYEAYPDWLHFVDSARELDRDNETVRRLRFTTLLPWPLADREALLECRVSQHKGGGEVVVHLNNRPKLLPPDPHYIRFPQLNGLLRFRRLGDGQVEVVYQLTLNPGGYIPTWLVNILLRDAPYFTLERLRRVVHRPEYQGRYFPFLNLNGPGRPATGTAPATLTVD
jgi:hypothetical protein